MKQKTNGKIVIAVVAMFAVAASIIGFTYAYFTAAFTQNNKDKTVEVTSGKLMARYTNGVSISVKNVVPGWISDNLHYYNVDNIVNGQIVTTDLSTEDAYTAVPEGETESLKTLLTADAWSEDERVDSYRRMGLTAPLKFTVSNISKESDIGDKIHYIIRLHVTKNGVKDFDYANYETTNSVTLTEAQKEDYKNVYVSLYRGTFTQGGTYTDDFGTGNVQLVEKKQLAATGETQILVTTAEEIAYSGDEAADTKNYFVVVEYANIDATQVAQGVDIDAEVEVIGVQGVDTNSDGTYDKFYDADNNEITFAS